MDGLLAAVASVFPAGAGMNRTYPASPARWTGVPRRRGDEPLQEVDGYRELLCSPQARG